ncbi:MAG: VOC family protein [Firmicutes bacterium]|nr:VOC family protein [Bacillota bacterium]
MLRLAFVELAVDDWHGALQFYRDTLGLKLSHLDPARRWALFHPPQGGSGVAVFARDPTRPEIALTFQCQDLDAAARELAARGAEPLGPPTTSEEGYRLLRLRDPAGRRLNLFEYTRWSGHEGSARL